MSRVAAVCARITGSRPLEVLVDREDAPARSPARPFVHPDSILDGPRLLMGTSR
jgi:hypothetical protein